MVGKAKAISDVQKGGGLPKEAQEQFAQIVKVVGEIKEGLKKIIDAERALPAKDRNIDGIRKLNGFVGIVNGGIAQGAREGRIEMQYHAARFSPSKQDEWKDGLSEKVNEQNAIFNQMERRTGSGKKLAALEDLEDIKKAVDAYAGKLTRSTDSSAVSRFVYKAGQALGAKSLDAMIDEIHDRIVRFTGMSTTLAKVSKAYTVAMLSADSRTAIGKEGYGAAVAMLKHPDLSKYTLPGGAASHVKRHKKKMRAPAPAPTISPTATPAAPPATKPTASQTTTQLVDLNEQASKQTMKYLRVEALKLLGKYRAQMNGKEIEDIRDVIKNYEGIIKNNGTLGEAFKSFEKHFRLTVEHTEYLTPGQSRDIIDRLDKDSSPDSLVAQSRRFAAYFITNYPSEFKDPVAKKLGGISWDDLKEAMVKEDSFFLQKTTGWSKVLEIDFYKLLEEIEKRRPVTGIEGAKAEEVGAPISLVDPPPSGAA